MINVLLRRKFLAGLTVGGAAVALHPVTREWITDPTPGADALRVPPLDGELRGVRPKLSSGLPSLDGELRDDADTLARVSEDYGRMVFQEPMAVLMPRSIEDVQKMVKYANEHRLTVGVRGAGHSILGQSQTTGILIDMSTLAEIHEVSEDHCVVDAGATWRDIVIESHPRGAVPRILPVDLFHTVGGLLAVGGMTPAAQRRGLAADHVVSLEVVTGAGELCTCSPFESPQLFEAALAGFGQGGAGPAAIIVRATLDMMPPPAEVRTHHVTFGDLRTFLRALETCTSDARFDELSGHVQTRPDGGWVYVLEGVSYLEAGATPDERLAVADFTADALSITTQDKDYVTWLTRGLAVAEHLVRGGAWDTQHPALHLMVPDRSAATFLEEALAGLRHEELASLPVRFVPVVAKHIARASFIRPRADVSFALLLDRFPREEADVDRMMEENEVLAERARALGGTPFGVSAVGATFDDAATLLGDEASTRLLEQKRRHDPRGVLAPRG